MPKPADKTGGPGKDDSTLEALVSPRLREMVFRVDEGGDNCLHELVLDTIERPLIQLVLERTRGNQLRAAQMLGINRNTLRKKIQRLGLDPTSTKKES